MTHLLTHLLSHVLKCFPDAIRLQSDDWYLSLKIPGADGATVVCPLSRLDDLREIHKNLPRPLSLVLLADCHLGQTRLPSSGFCLITPYGCFDINADVSYLKGFVPQASDKGSGCVECELGGWPCRVHMLSL